MSTITLPRTIGRFEIVGELGQGANSVVYLARSPEDPSEVALKVQKRALSYAEAYLGRHGSESKVASDLVHPGICRIFASGREGDRGYVVMELIRGRVLSDLIAEKGRLEPYEALHVGLQVAEALAYAHAQDVVHRDVKPDNLMITEDGQVKILDFGIARRGSSAQDTQAVGTPAYMSPEQARGEAVDARTDVYSLGAVLYHCLAGRPPFEGDDITELLSRVGSKAPPSLERAAPGVPRTLSAIIARAMAPNRDRRYPMAEAFVLELRRAQAEAAGSTVGAASGGAHRFSWIIVLVGLAALAGALVVVWKAGVFH